jgi:propanol-preferring alcohol dehydrogenase
MKAMLLRQPGPAEASPLQLSDLPEPRPGPNEILVNVKVCGVCRTDLHIVEAELTLPKLPIVPGHQVVGVVEAAGDGATRFRQGDRVGIPWLNHTCGQCAFCRRSSENLCDNARFTGFHVDGGYAERVVVHEDFAYRIPDIFADAEAAPLLCAGVIGMRSYRLSGVQPGERLGMYGFGASAHVTIQVAVNEGCEVFVFTRGEEHRRLAVELGASWAGSAEENAPAPLDAAIVFAPAGWLVPVALRAVRKGGAVSLAGIHMTPIPEMEYGLLYEERVLRSAANSTRKDVEDLLRAAAQIPIRTQVRTFALEEANEALQLLKSARLAAAAVLEVGASTRAAQPESA